MARRRAAGRAQRARLRPRGAAARLHARWAFGSSAAAARQTDAFLSVSRADIERGRALRPLRRPARPPRAQRHRRGPIRARASAARGRASRAARAGGRAARGPHRLPKAAEGAAGLSSPSRRRSRARGPTRDFFIAGDGELRPDVERACRAAASARASSSSAGGATCPSCWVRWTCSLLTFALGGTAARLPAGDGGRKADRRDRGGRLPEAVCRGRNGFLFEPGDVPRAVQAVLRVIGDPRWRRGWARRAARPSRSSASDGWWRSRSASTVRCWSAQRR
jgi:hypothetical protein